MKDAATGYYFTPCSVKAIVLDRDGVLLCLNDRDEWELPGGWPDESDSTLQDTVRREVFEETGLPVTVGRLITADLLKTPDGGNVALITYAATATDPIAPEVSHEHRRVEFFHIDELPRALPAQYRRAILKAHGLADPPGPLAQQ